MGFFYFTFRSWLISIEQKYLTWIFSHFVFANGEIFYENYGRFAVRSSAYFIIWILKTTRNFKHNVDHHRIFVYSCCFIEITLFIFGDWIEFFGIFWIIYGKIRHLYWNLRCLNEIPNAKLELFRIFKILKLSLLADILMEFLILSKMLLLEQ